MPRYKPDSKGRFVSVEKAKDGSSRWDFQIDGRVVEHDLPMSDLNEALRRSRFKGPVEIETAGRFLPFVSR